MKEYELSNTINTWLNELELYDFTELCIKPSLNSWSLGQLFVHIIEATEYFIEQAKICASNNDNSNEEATPEAKRMFFNNEFPDIKIDGPPSNDLTEQPQNKDQLVKGLLNLKDEAKSLEKFIVDCAFIGKTKHPGLNYFSAKEWLQFANMHLRHHFRQQKRIVEFLKLSQTN